MAMDFETATPKACVKNKINEPKETKAHLTKNGIDQTGLIDYIQTIEKKLSTYETVINSQAQTISYLEKCKKEGELSFINDINLHFTEIYERYVEIQNKIIQTSKEALNDLSQKYENMQNEKLTFIDPLIKRETRDNRSFLQKVRARINLFLKPKLGELNLYSPRPMNIPSRYTEVKTKTSLPKISVVTPSFNHGQFLERTINSIVNQNYPDLEYIIQDGKSTDQTLNIIKNYEPKIKHWASVKDNGQSHAINMGFEHATGEIMAYINSDDMLLPGTLHYVGKYFAAHPNIDVIYGHRILVNENDLEIGRWVLPPHDDQILSWADYIPQETLFWRRSLWEKVGSRIDENFQFAMDWDLILRFREVGANFARVPRFLGVFRIHLNQKTSSQLFEKGIAEMERLRERYHGRSVSNLEIQRATKKYLNHHVLYHKLYRLGLLRY